MKMFKSAALSSRCCVDEGERANARLDCPTATADAGLPERSDPRPPAAGRQPAHAGPRRPRATGGAGSAGRPGPGAYMNVSFVGLTDFGWSTEKDVPSLQLG